MTSEAGADISAPADSDPGPVFTSTETSAEYLPIGDGAPLTVPLTSIPDAFSEQARMAPAEI
ncbi:hypothetical protein ACFRAO_45030, partial [Streptomyces sp. NPDC056656]|uniref:hypothetical protein n=1 Tax=Streptomyces sp. NPDC056656 TaxID=3345895 RepID=UPI0036A926FF